MNIKERYAVASVIFGKPDAKLELRLLVRALRWQWAGAMRSRAHFCATLNAYARRLEH